MPAADDKKDAKKIHYLEDGSLRQNKLIRRLQSQMVERHNVKGSSILAAMTIYCALFSFAIASESDLNIKQPAKYDYAAVCDFISARLYEVEIGIADDSGSHISPAITRTNKSIAGFHYDRDGVSADFLTSGSKRIITSAHFDAIAIFQTDRKKSHLLSRLGMDANDRVGMLSVGCDGETLKMMFQESELTEVDISANFID